MLNAELGQLVQQAGEFGLAPWKALTFWEVAGALPPVAGPTATPSLSSSHSADDYHHLVHTSESSPATPRTSASSYFSDDATTR